MYILFLYIERYELRIEANNTWGKKNLKLAEEH